MTLKHEKDKSSLYIIMGVSGCGKSTIAKLLANKLACKLIEADDYHSQESKELMSKGVSLTEAERLPWVDKLCNTAQAELLSHDRVVMSYSGLKKHHRDKFRELNINIYFIFLKLPYEIISERLMKRKDHFVDESLLLSQFKDFEQPINESNTYSIDGDNLTDDIINVIIKRLKLH